MIYNSDVLSTTTTTSHTAATELLRVLSLAMSITCEKVYAVYHALVCLNYIVALLHLLLPSADRGGERSQYKLMEPNYVAYVLVVLCSNIIQTKPKAL